jgi:hypothetical protein
VQNKPNSGVGYPTILLSYCSTIPIGAYRATSPRCPASGNKPNFGRPGDRDGRLNVRNKANPAAAVRWASAWREKSYGGFDMRAKQSQFRALPGGSRPQGPGAGANCAKQSQFPDGAK